MKGLIITALYSIFFCVISVSFCESARVQKVKGQITFTVLYDNYIHEKGTQADWGFACLIEGLEKTVLFDSGTKSDILLHNAKILGKDLKNIDVMMISHDHFDHAGGIEPILKMNPGIPVYIPFGSNEKLKNELNELGAELHEVQEHRTICEHVLSTGVMGTQIKEHSLIISTSAGIVLLTGCSHPGIVEILEKTKEITSTNIHLVFGGFHLMQHSDKQIGNIIEKFSDLGVKKCGATHCTGDRQIQLFRKAYGDNYVPMGTGKIIKVNR